MRKLPRSIALLALALGGLWLARAGAAPTITFEIDPPNPVAGQTIRLRDTSPSAASSWVWDFGDGGSATTASPSHAWTDSGTYIVQLLAQGGSAEQTVTVTPETTVRLLAAHPFEISIDAKEPGTGANSPAQAVAVTDRFGWFSFPGLTHDAGNPEVTVKVLEAPTFGHYWIFWSAMTSLQYTMTVRDVSTDQVQVYEKTDDAPSGGWDLTSFPYAVTAAPSPTPIPGAPTSTPRPGQTNSPTRTRTRTPTPTATGQPTVTPTPTPSGPTMLTLRATSWQWTWCPSADQGIPGLACTPGVCPYEIEAHSVVNGVSCNGCVIHMHEGCSYQVLLYNGDPIGGEQTYGHAINSHPDVGIPATALPVGYIMPAPITVTIPAGTVDQDFNCTNSACADGGPPESTHERMLGTIKVDP
jgi:PKD repeat protein